MEKLQHKVILWMLGLFIFFSIAQGSFAEEELTRTDIVKAILHQLSADVSSGTDQAQKQQILSFLTQLEGDATLDRSDGLSALIAEVRTKLVPSTDTAEDEVVPVPLNTAEDEVVQEPLDTAEEKTDAESSDTSGFNFIIGSDTPLLDLFWLLAIILLIFVCFKWFKSSQKTAKKSQRPDVEFLQTVVRLFQNKLHAIAKTQELYTLFSQVNSYPLSPDNDSIMGHCRQMKGIYDTLARSVSYSQGIIELFEDKLKHHKQWLKLAKTFGFVRAMAGKGPVYKHLKAFGVDTAECTSIQKMWELWSKEKMSPSATNSQSLPSSSLDIFYDVLKEVKFGTIIQQELLQSLNILQDANLKLYIFIEDFITGKNNHGLDHSFVEATKLIILDAHALHNPHIDIEYLKKQTFEMNVKLFLKSHGFYESDHFFGQKLFDFLNKLDKSILEQLGKLSTRLYFKVFTVEFIILWLYLREFKRFIRTGYQIDTHNFTILVKSDDKGACATLKESLSENHRVHTELLRILHGYSTDYQYSLKNESRTFNDILFGAKTINHDLAIFSNLNETGTSSHLNENEALSHENFESGVEAEVTQTDEIDGTNGDQHFKSQFQSPHENTTGNQTPASEDTGKQISVQDAKKKKHAFISKK